MQQAKKVFESINADVARLMVDRNNPTCPFANFIGNADAVEVLSDIAFKGLLTAYRACPGVGVAVYGQHSTGKTTAIKLFSELLDLPVVFLQGSEITSVDYLLNIICKCLDEENLYLVPVDWRNGKNCYEIPPMVVFIDEIHALPPHVSQGLLSALEQATSVISTSDSEANCSNIYWMIATTEKGKLSLPFESRFISVNLLPYTLREIANIIQINTRWSLDICLKISRFARIPRDAIAFAKQVDFAASRSNKSLLECVDIIAKRRNVNEDGLDIRQINTMIVLAQNVDTGKSLKSLCSSVGVNVEEMGKYVLPVLLMETKDRKALIKVSNRHHITDFGIDFLKKRGKLP